LKIVLIINYGNQGMPKQKL